MTQREPFMHRRITRLFLLALTASFVPMPAPAQQAAGPDQPDLTLDARTRSAVIESLLVSVRSHYVFPEKAEEVAKAIRRRASRKEYDAITSSKEFADSLTAHLQAVTHDLHLRVHYRYEPLPEQMGDDGPPPPEELRRMREAGRVRNFGFERVERLAGNVGYLDLRMFSGDPAAQATAVAAMNFLGNSDAIIIDLRRNGGGSPAMIQTLLTYFVSDMGERLHFNDFYERGRDGLEQWYTSAYVPGQRLDGKPLYVLTSSRTGSAAEEFSYDVKTHKLGTLVGAKTAGGANPGGLFRLNEHFGAFIATGRAINPITKTNWEGVGVEPDVAVPAESALREAHMAALTKLIAQASDDDQKAALNAALEQAKSTPDQPAELFQRPQRRKAS
jgi:retinol-binding protein 3